MAKYKDKTFDKNDLRSKKTHMRHTYENNIWADNKNNDKLSNRQMKRQMKKTNELTTREDIEKKINWLTLLKHDRNSDNKELDEEITWLKKKLN